MNRNIPPLPIETRPPGNRELIMATDRGPRVPLPPEILPLDADQTPHLPPGSALALTRKQIDDLYQDTEGDYTAVKKDMDGGWRQKRKTWLLMSEFDYSHRKSGDVGGKKNVYDHSNVSMDICNSDALRSSGRLQRDLIGTWPYYNLTPQGWKANPDGTTDKELAQAMERYAHFKTKGNSLGPALSEGLDLACVLSEAVVRTYHTRDAGRFKTLVNVMAGDDGKPLTTAGGEFIFDTDSWTPQEDGAALFLDKDPAVTRPADGPVQWIKQPWAAELVHYEGPVSEVCWYEDFHAPTNVKSLDEARSLYYDRTRTLSQLRAEFQIDAAALRILRKEPPTDNDGERRTLMGWLDYIRSWFITADHRDAAPRAQAEMQQPHSGEGLNTPPNSSTYLDPTYKVTECWRQVDVDGDGALERVYLVADFENKVLLYWDYAANIAPNGRHNFRVLRKRAKRNRWYGIGDYEEGDVDGEQIDYFINRSIYSNQFAGSIGGYDSTASDEFAESPPEPGRDKLYALKDGKKMADVVSWAQFPPLTDDAMDVMQLLMQKHSLSKPSINPGQQNMAQLPASRLATGIKALQDVADDLYVPRRMEAERCVAAVIECHLENLFFRMPEQEVYEYTEGENILTARLARKRVADLKMNVGLTLTRMRALEISSKSETARAMILEFHTKVPAYVQPIVAPFYIDQFRSMEIPNAKSYFTPGTPPPMDDPTAGAPVPAGPQDPTAPDPAAAELLQAPPIEAL
jgi:hypothetical protein